MPASKFELLTRIGFFARGIMYLVIGLLALWAGRSADPAGALERLGSGSGRILLAVMALGFLGYALWRLSEAIADTEGNGSDAKGKAMRAGGVLSGLVHLGLFFIAASIAVGSSDGSNGDSARRGARLALHLPAGELLLVVAAAGLLATGAVQLVRAAKAGFLRHLAPEAARLGWVKALGRAGYAARGIVFLVMGWFLLRAAIESDAREAGGMGAVLASLAPSIRLAVAAGLLLFGLFSFVEARHRRINDAKVLERLQRQGARLANRV